jgi:hypothetical protein
MIESKEERPKLVRLGAATTPVERLPYKVDLWNQERRDIERVLARAASAVLARAMFEAARNEHPERYITLRRGTRLIAETA